MYNFPYFFSSGILRCAFLTPVFSSLTIYFHNCVVIGGDYNENIYPGARNRHGLVNINNTLYLFGGWGYGQESECSPESAGYQTGEQWYLGDLWSFSIKSGAWKFIHTANSSVSQRCDFEGVYKKTDDNESIYPGSRRSFAMSAVAPNGGFSHLFFVHGGLCCYDNWGVPIVDFDTFKQKGDLWEFNTETLSWTFIEFTPVLHQGANFNSLYGDGQFGMLWYPGARIKHEIVADTQFVYMFGGLAWQGGDDPRKFYLAELWVYSIELNEWRFMDYPAGVTNHENYLYVPAQWRSENGDFSEKLAHPGSRWEHSLFMFNSSLFVFGGRGLDMTNLGKFVTLCDLWEFSFEVNRWRWINTLKDGNTTNVLTLLDQPGVVFEETQFNKLNYPGSRATAEIAVIASHEAKEETVFLYSGISGINGGSVITHGQNLWEFDAGRQLWRRHLDDFFRYQYQYLKSGRFPDEDEDSIDFSEWGYFIPPSRYGFGFAPSSASASTKSLFIFGGKFGNTLLMGDLWEYSPENGLYRWLVTNSEVQRGKNFFGFYGCDSGSFYNTDPSENARTCCPINTEGCSRCGATGICSGCERGYKFKANLCVRKKSGNSGAGAIVAAILLPLLLLCFSCCLAAFIFAISCIVVKRKQRATTGKYSEAASELLQSQSEGTSRIVRSIVSKLELEATELIDYDSLKHRSVIAEAVQVKIFKCEYHNIDSVLKAFYMKGNEEDSYDILLIQREADIVSKIRHKHIVQFFGFCVHNDMFGIVLEECQKGNLKTYLKSQSNSNTPVGMEEKVRYLFEISLAMEYLHSSEINVIHRDLKPSNCLITSHNICKVADFGLSREAFQDRTMTSGVGTSIFISPECVLGKPYSLKADSYSFSMLCYTVISEIWMPFATAAEGVDLHEYGMLFKLANDEKLKPDATIIENEELRLLITTNWKHSQDDRWSFKRIRETLSSIHAYYKMESSRKSLVEL